MKKIGFSIAAAAFTMLITGCDAKKAIYLSRPDDTNLEFWITQSVAFEDFKEKGCTYLPGWFGADEYLDSRYVADTREGQATAPDIHVTYLLTGYPDTIDGKAITRIEITDPSITVYGLSLISTAEEIKTRMKGVADSISDMSENNARCVVFKIKNCSFGFASGIITISVPVTNNNNVQY